MEKVSCIIPAFNEAPRIAGVLNAVDHHPLLKEVIVIDDCSTDYTRDEVKKFPLVRLVEQPVNQGKSAAIARGIREATSEFIFMLDADLIGLEAKDITAMIEPVLAGSADITISLRKNSPWRPIGLDYISGERVFHRKLVDDSVDEIKKLHGFGLEVFLNQLIIKNKYRIKIVYWPKVISPFASKKVGLKAGVRSFMTMLSHMLKTIPFSEMVYQVVLMLWLSF